jgi:dipeptidyl aminopeptidase/acylaminoacyl peptidase
VLAGGSWGGYLALLGAGVQAADWRCVIASSPIADYPAAYAQETDILRAFDRAMFGGGPDEVLDHYRAASPLTYAEQVTAPVLVMNGAADTRCPPEQLNGYVRRLERLGVRTEKYVHSGGHGMSASLDEERWLSIQLDFVKREIGSAEVWT